ncbi:MAG: hypothetical protein AAFR37_23755, partial [Cyanobacteria bacterium J06628_3]
SKINRRLASVTKIKIVNKLFSATTTTQEMSNHHAVFFEQHSAVNHKDEMGKLEEIVSQYETGDERQKAAFSYLEKQMKTKIPEIEELETHFYEDGIESVAMSLRMRQIEAMEHWKGNKNFSQFDIMTTLFKDLDSEDF